MNYRSRIFILSGIYALIAIFISKQMFSAYYYGEMGVEFLPLDIFELSLFGIAILTFLVTLITMFVIIKSQTYPLTFKKRFHFLIPAFMGWVIIFLMLRENLSEYIVPAAIIIYGLILLNLNRFVTSRLVYFGGILLLLGIVVFIWPMDPWWLVILAFGAFPIVFGLMLLKKSKLDESSNST